MSELIHTCYRITDIDRSVSFYEKLGFEEPPACRSATRRPTSSWACPATATGSSSPSTTAAPSRTRSAPGYGHIALTVDDLDSTLERLAADGIEPEKPPYSVREGGSRLCFVRDPDDYRIELIERRG